MKLFETLNKYSVGYSENDGEITLESAFHGNEGDAYFDAEGNVTDPGLNKLLDELDGYEAYLSAHPEGADRGGYVCYVDGNGETAMWDHHDCEWVEA